MLTKQHLRLDNMLITCGFSKQDEMLIDVVMIVQSIKRHKRSSGDESRLELCHVNKLSKRGNKAK